MVARPARTAAEADEPRNPPVMTAFLELRVPTSRVVAGPGSAPLQPLSERPRCRDRPGLCAARGSVLHVERASASSVAPQAQDHPRLEARRRPGRLLR